MRSTNLLLDPDADEDVVTPAGLKPVHRLAPADPDEADDPNNEDEDAGGILDSLDDTDPDDDGDDEDEEGKAKDKIGVDVLKKLHWEEVQELNALAIKVRQAGPRPWPFLWEATDRIVLCLAEVLRRDGDAALRAACAAYILARRPHLEGMDIRTCWNSDYLNEIEDSEEEDNEYTDEYVAEFVARSGDERADVNGRGDGGGALGGNDDGEVVTIPTKGKKAGKPQGVGPKKAAGRAAKKVDVSKLKAAKRVAPPPSIFTKKWTGRGVYVPEWVMAAVGAVTPVREKSPHTLYMLLAQMAYWERPGSDGKPRSARSVLIDGVWWIQISPTALGKEVGGSLGKVRTAIARLVSLGLIERRVIHGVYGPNTIHTRVKWEVMQHLLAVEGVMKPHRVREPEPSGTKVAPKKSRKDG